MNKKYVDLDEILLALPKNAAKIIEGWPAADVRPVRAARWTDAIVAAHNLYDSLGMMASMHGYVCSCCQDFSVARYSFCPNCGADMRGNNE